MVQDMWGLGCIVWEVYNGPLGSPNDLARMGKIPTKLSATYMELVAAKPEKRPTSRYVFFSMIKGGSRLNFEVMTSKKSS